ncbi:MAG: GNAT family N-acetyltransferase, partial [Acutalibacteraceae bacterium]
MLISCEKKYIPDLFSLWKTCFHDEDGYINLFFEKEYENCKIFACFENGEIVSVLYLLDCFISLDRNRYDGYYLYAAATKPESRGKGLMSALIKEAEDFAKKEGKAFIALVPGEESLYGYYKRFGFDKTMYKFKTKACFDGVCCAEKCETDDYLNFRLSRLDSCVQFEQAEFSYAACCYEYAGVSVLKGDSCRLISDGKTVYEFLGENTEVIGQKE